jgi:5'-3' exonuclease
VGSTPAGRSFLHVKLLLVDGHYYAYRSFFAIRNLSNSRGEPTNAIYGFIKTIRRMVKDLQPELGAVIWDEGLPDRRTQLQPAYKQQRAEMPADLSLQLTTIQKIVPLLGFQSLGLPNTEADDLMATYACEAIAKKIEVVLATNDKDLFQLVADGVKVYTTNKADLAGPKETYALLDKEHVRRKWGVDPERIGDVLCLIGDSVDNIPGVPGLGPKNASALIEASGGIQPLLDNIDAVKNERIREKIRSAREQILQNREMVKLDTDLPVPMPVEDLKIRPKYDELITALTYCEFKSLLEEVKTEALQFSKTVQGELFV